MMYVKFDTDTNTLLSAVQTFAGNGDGWYEYSDSVQKPSIDQTLQYRLVNNVVTATVIADPAFSFSDFNRGIRNKLLRETTLEGWGDFDYRELQTADTLSTWDAYRASLRNLPITISTFSTALLQDSDLPVKP
jgi:hypothetical protein